jgi:hypothetical protein
MRRLALPLLISVFLHLLVLSQLHWGGPRATLNEPPRLTVNFVPNAQAEGHRQQFSPVTKQEPSSTARINALDAKASDYQLDLNQIHEQVRTYARQEMVTSQATVPVVGDYFGTYTGRDSGIFFFHLDKNGHAVGNGQSDSFGIAFLIEGDVSPNGDIQAVGAKYVGESKFSGKLRGSLDRRTGKISGTWLVNKTLQGNFSGQREMQVSMN